MADVYFPNIVLLLVVAVESLVFFLANDSERQTVRINLRNYSLYILSMLIAFSPTLAIRAVLFGNPFAAGAYGNQSWNWTSPAFLQVLFSPTQGLLTTTPIVIPALIGIFLLLRRDGVFGRGLVATFAAFCALLAIYPFWNLGPSFGNRYFLSLLPAFILGLSLFLEECARHWRNANAFARRAWAVAILLAVWNLGLVFQWSTGLMPDVGRVYWQEVLYNQFRIVPGEALHALHARFSFHPSNQDGAREADLH
jgi:hypothetical protein